MTEDRGDWVVDTEGNLTSPDGDGLKPPTDEFGRDDPASLERERRRRERELRRGKAKEARKPVQAPAPVEQETPAPQPVQATPKAPRRSTRQRAADGRDAMRERFGRGDGTARPPRPTGTYRRRRFLALALVLVGVLVAWFLIAFFQPPPFDPGEGSGEAIVTVPEGATAGEVADLLSRNDVVSNGTLFQWRLKLAGESGKILPGRYVLAHNMSYGSAIDKLTSSGGQVNVTIPEGDDRTQIAATIKDLGLSGHHLASTKSHKRLEPNHYRAQKPPTLAGLP